MAGTWKPKYKVRCNREALCGWKGKRAIIHKPCPRCGRKSIERVVGRVALARAPEEDRGG